MMRVLIPPASDELEVSIFGPGYGESIAIHLGNSHWVLIDSCVEPNSANPASLGYLRALGINVEEDVKLIVATHWHDDYIRGISTLLRECKSATFVISNALTNKNFLELVKSYSIGSVMRRSGIDEFTEVFRIFQESRQKGNVPRDYKLALADKLLYHPQIRLADRSVEVKVYALSPSDASVIQGITAFANLVPMPGQRQKKILSLTPNDASVVLWVEVDSRKILLGADLQNTQDPKTGWIAIWSNNLISVEADIFKVAHHGAENAHDPNVWNQLLVKDPFAILSPFCLADEMLPTAADIDRIKSLTSKAYITSLPAERRYKWREKIVREFLSEIPKKVRSVQSGWGHIRLRSRINSSNNQWQVELFGDAHPLNEDN